MCDFIVVADNYIVFVFSEFARTKGFVESFFGKLALQSLKEISRKRFVFVIVFDFLEDKIIVNYHLFAFSTWTQMFCEHFFGVATRSVSTLELTGSNRLFYDASGEIFLTVFFLE